MHLLSQPQEFGQEVEVYAAEKLQQAGQVT
jgi:hypothetical protein